MYDAGLAEHFQCQCKISRPKRGCKSIKALMKLLENYPEIKEVWVEMTTIVIDR